MEILLWTIPFAFAVGAPVRGGPSREVLQSQMLERIRARHAARLKRWSGAELAALFLLLADARPTAETAVALETLREAQSASGSFGEHPGATLVGLAALRRWTPGSEAFTRALDFLVRERTAEGLWCFSHADVWDTALLCRALKGCEDLAPTMFARAGSFLLRAQNEDGGWSYRGGVESDTDTTAMALLALPRTDAMRAALEAGRDYLERMRTPDGLWRTWQSRCVARTLSFIAFLRVYGFGAQRLVQQGGPRAEQLLPCRHGQCQPRRAGFLGWTRWHVST